MSEPRIKALHFAPVPGSRWTALRVGMTFDEALRALGERRKDRGNIYDRVYRGKIVFDLPLPQQIVIVSDISDADTGRGVEEPPRQTKTRPCLRCRRAFMSEGPGNRLCSDCRGRNVSPFEPG